ncbi:hypothetical protein PtA15_1A488 [Puccinia triticina]|uniref:Uncharacterized protein n=1 Tax=Puccinia triticina TaxID=208348 RepID=A0ABY7C7M8_9BASI|nr:uncharacterized protein PtA15_1A488 [Puccinia triticina]WAQ81149.1 hypothetical protein PtA15_1A488 [Puccinia triticina]
MQDPSPKTSVDFTKQHRLQGDEVIQWFRCLRNIWEAEPGSEVVDGSPSNQQMPLIDHVNSEEDLLIRVHSWILPYLREQLAALLPLLKPTELQTEPGSKLDLILELQFRIAGTMTRFQSAIAMICPQPLCCTERLDDQFLKQSKAYRLDTLSDRAHDSITSTTAFFDAARQHIQQMGLTTQESVHEVNSAACYVKCNQDASDKIEKTICCLKAGSEIDFIEYFWASDVRWLEQFPEDTSEIFIPDNPTRAQLRLTPEKVPPEPVIKLIRLSMPISILSKLFFKTIRRMMNTNRSQLPPYTAMNSKQLKCLCESARETGHRLCNLICLMYTIKDTAYGVETRYACREARSLLDGISSRLSAVLLIVMLHIVPMVPNTDGLSDQKYYKTWLTMWHNLMVSAIDNFGHSSLIVEHIPN